MTKQHGIRWMPVLLAAPVVAGMFGIATTWALTTDPSVASNSISNGQSQQTVPATLMVPAGPSSHAAQLEQNQQRIDELASRLELTKAQIAELQSQTLAISAPSTSAPSGASSWQSPSNGSAQAPAGPPASAPATAPAPPVNTTTGAS